MPPKYKLTYFNLRGRAEATRLIFALMGVEYEDERLEREDWPNHKHRCPNGQMPILEIDGKVYSQGYAFQRYLARQYGLAGKSALEELRADMIVDTLEDLFRSTLPGFFMNDKQEKAKWADNFAKRELPTILQNLEKMLIENQGGDEYFVGDELTWAELNFISTIDWVGSFGITPEWSKYPKLGALRDKVLQVPQIAAWIAKRPVTVC